MKKIEWSLAGISTTTLPASGATGTTLKVQKYGFGSNPLQFRLMSENAELSRGSGPFIRLNNTRVKVTELTFGHTRDNTNEQSLIKVTVTAENKPDKEETIFFASTTLTSTFKI